MFVTFFGLSLFNTVLACRPVADPEGGRGSLEPPSPPPFLNII